MGIHVYAAIVDFLLCWQRYSQMLVAALLRMGEHNCVFVCVLQIGTFQECTKIYRYPNLYIVISDSLPLSAKCEYSNVLCVHCTTDGYGRVQFYSRATSASLFFKVTLNSVFRMVFCGCVHCRA